MRNGIAIVLLSWIVLSGCVIHKQVPEGKLLVRSESIILQNPNAVNNRAKLKKELASKINPKVNYGIGNMGLWIYYKTQTEKQKGLKQWINKKFGKQPIYFQSNIFDRIRLNLKNYIHDKGYFGSQVKMDTITNGALIDLSFQIKSHGQFQINNIFYPADSLPFASLFQAPIKPNNLLKGQYYLKDLIDQERLRLYNKMGEEGYLDFEKDSIIFYLDTTKAGLKTDVYINIQSIQDSTNFRKYQIGNTYVFPDYNLDTNDSIAVVKDTIRLPRLNIIQTRKVLKSKALNRVILLGKGTIANTTTHYQAVNKFQNLGVFKFTNTNFVKRISQDTAYLDRYFYLTPGLTQEVVAEFEINNRTGDFFGTAVVASYIHKNLFKGAERFDATVSGGIETQLGQSNSFTNTVDLNVGIKLTVPHFVLPFNFSIKNAAAAKTTLSISNSFQIRNDYFTLSAFNASYGYEWKPNKKTTLGISPLRMNLLNLLSTTEAFDSILMETPRLQLSFQNSFILGLDFYYQYNSQTNNNNLSYILANVGFSTSGNMLSLFNNSLSQSEDGSKEFLGVAYTQYIKIVPEFKYYIPKKKSLIAMRFGLGLGLPYGNSKELPYIEQFFVGGSNSIRAFRIRQLGPGLYLSEDTNNQVDYYDQTGDIKLEINLDYRFNLVGFLKGAFFVDAANIWLLQSAERPEGVFQIDNFYKEIAIGTGFGLRLDFDFFVIRLDSSFALRRPTTDGFQWTFSDIRFFEKSWRKKNLLWNLAIGYPF